LQRDLHRQLIVAAYFSFSTPSAGEAGLAFFCAPSSMFLRAVGLEAGSVMPAPVVARLCAAVPRDGMPLMLSPDISVGAAVFA
jgi:hypothetical protein